jgi:hypothetical protein
MISARTRIQLRFVALLYAMFGTVYLCWIAVVWSYTPSTSSASLVDQAFARYALGIPFVAAGAVVCFVLSGLSLNFLRLGWSWRIGTIAGSSLLSLNFLWGAVRHSADVAPKYLARVPPDHIHLAIDLGSYWGLTLLYSICSFLLWRQLRTSNHRGRVRDAQ